MDKQAIIEKLRELKKERGVLGKIEWEVGIPENNLSGYVSEKKKMPDKWVKALSDYFESGQHEAKKIELPADYLSFKKIGILKEDGTVEDITNFEQILSDQLLLAKDVWQSLSNDLFNFGMAVTYTDGISIRRVHPLSPEVSAALHNAEHTDSKIFIQPPEPPPIEEAPNDKAQIEKMITAIRNEKIPAHRDTTFGRKSWKIEQDKRINELQKQII